MSNNPFETFADVYDRWYDDFPSVFASEVLALRAVLPCPGDWVEVGVGTGRFAAELGIRTGIEPAEAMAALARRRGIDVIHGVAEALPLASGSVDCVLFITSLCFVDDIETALEEAFRVLRPDGCCVIGLLPLDSALGQATQARASEDHFFKNAHLRTKDEVLQTLQSTGFGLERSAQALWGSPQGFEGELPSQKSGHDCGSFVAFRAVKTQLAAH